MTECACACTSLIFSSFIGVLSLVCVDPRYLNQSTSSTIFSIIRILVDGLGLTLLTTILLLSKQISMPYPAAVFSSLSVSCCCSSSLPPSRSMSSANRKLHSDHPPIVLRWTLTIVGCQFLLHLLLHPDAVEDELPKLLHYLFHEYVK